MMNHSKINDFFFFSAQEELSDKGIVALNALVKESESFHMACYHTPMDEIFVLAQVALGMYGVKAPSQEPVNAGEWFELAEGLMQARKIAGKAWIADGLLMEVLYRVEHGGIPAKVRDNGSIVRRGRIPCLDQKHDTCELIFSHEGRSIKIIDFVITLESLYFEELIDLEPMEGLLWYLIYHDYFDEGQDSDGYEILDTLGARTYPEFSVCTASYY